MDGVLATAAYHAEIMRDVETETYDMTRFSAARKQTAPFYMVCAVYMKLMSCRVLRDLNIIFVKLPSFNRL